MTFSVIKPDLDHLPGFIDALAPGWSPDNFRGAEAAREIVAGIEGDPAAFIEGLDDPEARAGPITMPDGSRALGMLLSDAACLGLPWVELTTDPDDVASQNVILMNRGYLMESFEKPVAYGGDQGLRYRIDLGGQRVCQPGDASIPTRTATSGPARAGAPG